MISRMICIVAIGMLACSSAFAGGPPTPQGAAFTYQGVLKVSGTPANGTHHLRFQLWDAPTAGAQVGADIDVPDLIIENGLFTTPLNFGPTPFDGSARWLEVAVVTNGGATVTTLSPRQPVNATPYALFALGVDGPSLTNLNASNLASGVVPGAQLAGTYGNALTLSNAANIFTGAFTGSGAGLTNLDGSNIASGNLAPAHLPTGGAWTLSSALNLDAATLTVDPVNNRVGIGTSTPGAPLHVADGSSGALPPLPNSLVVESDNNETWMSLLAPEGHARGIFFGEPSDALSGGILYDANSPNGFEFRTGGNVANMVISGSGDVGIGTTSPERLLHLRDTGPVIILQDTATAANQAGYLGFWNDASVETGWVGFGTPGSPTLSVWNQRPGGNVRFLTQGVERLTILSDGRVGIGTTTPTTGLTVAGTVRFNAPDGNYMQYSVNRLLINRNSISGSDLLVEFRTNDAQQGSISVSGSTVSYNGFMGSHYGWVDGEHSIERGALVRMTGENRRLNDSAESDVVYGIEPTARANDPACLGAYLGIMESDKPADLDNPHLVAAVGNGEVLVVDSGTGDIQPGDYLISADVAGCAMKDDPQRFAVGHVVARAAQRVDWSAVTSEANGRKVARVSVFFESFMRTDTPTKQASEPDAEIASLNGRIAELERLVQEALAERRR